jgi:Na+/H+-dicarboxylate symporter
MLVGIVVAQWLRPGAALAGAAALAPGAAPLPAAPDQPVPNSIVRAMADNQILPIVLFSVLFGVAAAHLGERAARLVEVIEQLGAVLIKLTGYIMLLAPLAVFCALAATVLAQGAGVLPAYARFVASFYVGLALLWALLAGVAFAALGRRAGGHLRAMREPALIAFSTASSEAAYPRTLEQLESQGVSPRIAAFVLPLGYSFNMDGAAMYCIFAVLFVAQAYRVELGAAQLAGLVGVLLVTGKGIAGVPRASLLVVAAALAYAKLPAQGLVMILAVDHLLDMGRSATNVLGNAVAAAVIGRWEGEL